MASLQGDANRLTRYSVPEDILICIIRCSDTLALLRWRHTCRAYFTVVATTLEHRYIASITPFFPNIERITAVPGIMETNKEQHRAFTPGFEAFHKYAETCSPADFDGQRIRELVEGFAEPLTKHLHDEIDTLRALDKYDSESVRKAYKQLEKLLMATDNVSSPLPSLPNTAHVTPFLSILTSYLVPHRSPSLWNCRSYF